MTPHHLHATAAAWSLQAALDRLARRADTERRAIIAELMEPPPLLRSPVWGRRQALGGHGDPTTGAVIDTERPPRRNRYAELAADITARLTLPAGHLPGDGNPLDRILTAIPGMLPGTASATTKLLVRCDERVRQELRIGSDRRHLVDIACPACGERALYVQTAGPEHAWTVVCTGSRRDGRHNPCLCVGQGCPCRMEGAVEGVAHIWPRAAVLGAVAGAAPMVRSRCGDVRCSDAAPPR